MSKIKKLRIDLTELHAKFQPKRSKNEGVIHDLEILLVKKNLVTFEKSFGMVSYGYISILVPFGATQPEISSNVNTESKGGVLL